MKYPGKTNNNR